MDIQPITPTIGAEISEVNLAALDSSSFAAIEDAFLKAPVENGSIDPGPVDTANSAREKRCAIERALLERG